ncbi:MAG: NUDIX domain-containing protein [Thaumarchaeota archaeon]|nr:NUDIX domain-containing protein [Nitrososphaerota archaeon]
MELLCHVDEGDRMVGPVERAKAHREGYLHRSGLIFLKRSDGRILVQHRSSSKETFPGRVDGSAAFHVTYGETYESAARRELTEETGVTAHIEFVGKFMHNDPPEHEIVAVFTCESDDEITVDPSESDGFEFLSGEEIDAAVSAGRATPWLRDGWLLMTKGPKTPG